MAINYKSRTFVSHDDHDHNDDDHHHHNDDDGEEVEVESIMIKVINRNQQRRWKSCIEHKSAIVFAHNHADDDHNKYL